jgi:hypothetical protein
MFVAHICYLLPDGTRQHARPVFSTARAAATVVWHARRHPEFCAGAVERA